MRACVCVRVCVHTVARVCACACACVCVCARACVRVSVSVCVPFGAVECVGVRERGLDPSLISRPSGY